MKYIYIYIGLLICAFSNSQNLVPNPGFETYTLCPTNSCNIEQYAANWNSATANSSTDYFNTCSPSCKLSTQNAKTGNGYGGLFLLGASSSIPNTRDYLQVQLINPLVQNITYYVEFFVLVRDLSIISGCNNVSANLSVARPYTNNWGAVQALTPHVQNSGNPIINDKINWVQISGCYTAQGGEEYLTIGNFMDDANTQTTGTTTSSYYLVDDVRVEEMTSVCVTGLRDLSYLSEFVGVSPNPTTDILKITYNSTNKTGLQIKITDIVDREIKTLEYDASTTSTSSVTGAIEKEIDITDLEKGIYFLSLYQNSQLMVIKKIIKE